MIISHKRFEEEVNRRVDEIMSREWLSKEMDKLREDTFREMQRLHDRIDATMAQVEELKMQLAMHMEGRPYETD